MDGGLSEVIMGFNEILIVHHFYCYHILGF